MSGGASTRRSDRSGRRRWVLGAVALLVLVAVVTWLAVPSGPPGPSQQSTTPTDARAARGVLTAGSGLPSGPLRAPGGPYLYDRSGRVVFLHGVNAVYKRPPFELSEFPGRPWSFTAADARRIASLGFDEVRLGILWEGLEPAPIGPNDPAICTPGPPGDPHLMNRAVVRRYLATITRVVDLLGRYHVYSLLDMHQDVYSQAFTGEGAPAWAICTDSTPIVPLPGRWSRNYKNAALKVAENHFWLNDVVGNLQGQFDQNWALVARHFADNPWVVGYDPYNEPFSFQQATDETHSYAVDLECFYTGRAHPGTLETDGGPVACPASDPAEGVVPTIEHADPHHLVFVEPDNFSVRGGGPSLLGPMPFPRLVYNFHSYCGFRSPVTGDPTRVEACADQELRSIVNRDRERPAMATIHQPGGPAWFMSEFGATASVPLLDEVAGFTDGLQLGWDYWAWKYYDDPTGSSDEALVQPDGSLASSAHVLARPYAQAIAGTPISTSFDDHTNGFRLVYAPSPRISAPTVVTIPTIDYPGGYCAAVTGGFITTPSGALHLSVVAAPSADQVTVTVDPGGCRA